MTRHPSHVLNISLQSLSILTLPALSALREGLCFQMCRAAHLVPPPPSPCPAALKCWHCQCQGGHSSPSVNLHTAVVLLVCPVYSCINWMSARVQLLFKPFSQGTIANSQRLHDLLTRKVCHKHNIKQLCAVVQLVLYLSQFAPPVRQVHQQRHHPRCGAEGAPICMQHIHSGVHCPEQMIPQCWELRETY